MLDVSASFDPQSGKGAVFIVNRSLTETLQTTLEWRGSVPAQVSDIQQLAGTDPKAANTWEQPDLIGLKKIDGMRIDDGRVVVDVPPLSFSVLAYE